MKKLLLFTSVFFFITTMVLAYILLFTGTELVKMPDDERVLVKYPPDLKDFVLSEMRDYLEVINEINQGIAENNPEKITKAAYRQGNAFLDDTPARLLKLSPVPCKTMGFKGHDLFQAIYDSARVNYKPQVIQKQMAELTKNCITCHRTYRINK
jgi:hypothetical protein